MEATTTNMISTLQTGRPSMAEAVARLRMEFSNIKSELQCTKSENDRLKDELARFRSRYERMPNMEIPKLRRQVTFYCHPDRGGDDDLMGRLNALFDFLTAAQCV